MDFIMEDLDSTSNDVYDDDWMMEEPEMEDEENNEDDHMDESDDDMFSGTNEETLDNHYTEGSVLTADTIHNDDASEDVAHRHNTFNKRDYSPNFTGLGKCKCGCGSFVGCGSICEACGHSYKAHGPY